MRLGVRPHSTPKLNVGTRSQKCVRVLTATEYRSVVLTVFFSFVELVHSQKCRFSDDRTVSPTFWVWKTRQSQPQSEESARLPLLRSHEHTTGDQIKL